MKLKSTVLILAIAALAVAANARRGSGRQRSGGRSDVDRSGNPENRPALGGQRRGQGQMGGGPFNGSRFEGERFDGPDAEEEGENGRNCTNVQPSGGRPLGRHPFGGRNDSDEEEDERGNRTRGHHGHFNPCRHGRLNRTDSDEDEPEMRPFRLNRVGRSSGRRNGMGGGQEAFGRRNRTDSDGMGGGQEAFGRRNRTDSGEEGHEGGNRTRGHHGHFRPGRHGRRNRTDSDEDETEMRPFRLNRVGRSSGRHNGMGGGQEAFGRRNRTDSDGMGGGQGAFGRRNRTDSDEEGHEGGNRTRGHHGHFRPGRHGRRNRTDSDDDETEMRPFRFNRVGRPVGRRNGTEGRQVDFGRRNNTDIERPGRGNGHRGPNGNQGIHTFGGRGRQEDEEEEPTESQPTVIPFNP